MIKVGLIHKEQVGPPARQFLFLLVAAIFFSFPLPLMANSDKELFAPGIYVTLPPDQEVETEEVVTYIFRLENQTDETVSLQVKAVSSQGWPLLGSTEELTLTPASEDYLVYSLLIPATILADSKDELRLILSAKDREKVFTVQTTVKTVRLLEWEHRPLLRAHAGEKLFFPVRLRNQGTTIERLELEIQSDKGWPVYANYTRDTIAPGQEGEVMISCYVPEAVPTGTLGEISLRLRDAGPEIPELKLKILISEAQNDQRDQDLKIPLNSAVSFNYGPPSQQSALPWNLTWRSRANLFANTHFDLFFSGAYDSLAPTAAYMGVKGEKWALRLGALGHNWGGPISPPTYSSFLYYQDQRTLPWSLWLGPPSQGVTPRWWGTQIHFKQPDLQLNYLQNSEPDSYFQHALAGTYQLYASPLYGWKLTTEAALGLGETNPLNQGGITLSHRDENREYLGQYKLGTDFYDRTTFNEFALTAYLYPPGELTLTTGYAWRGETSLANSILDSYKLWSELMLGNHRFGVAYTLRSDREIKEVKASTTQRHLKSSLSFSMSYSREDLESQRKSFILGANYRYRFTTDNYLETLYKETFTYSQGQAKRLPEIGLKWRYTNSNKPWNCFGLIQWDLSPKPSSQISAFQAGLGAQTAARTAWQVYTQLYFEEKIPYYSLIFRLEHQDLYFLPSPWSGIHGKAFVDLNRNGIYEPNEPGLAGLPVLLNGSEAAISKEDGSWEISFTSVGRQILDFPAQCQNYYTLEAKKELSTEPNKSVFVLVPYFPPTEIQGRLFIDTNRNNNFDAGEKGLSGTVIAIFDRNHQLIIEKSTTSDGAFFFTLLPGEYLLELKEESLADYYLLPEPLPFKVTTASPLTLSVAVTPVIKEIEFFNEEIIPPELWEAYTEESW